MATRLDRLWVLLDSGSTQVTRKAAADQIGEVQKLHPHELHNLLRKVRTYLTSKSWDTRIAAGQAVEAISRNVKKWQPSYQPKMEGEGNSPPPDPSDNLLTFDSFNIRQVLTHGTPLLSSTGDEYQSLESDPEYQRMTAQERVAFHRQQLRQRLGLVAQGKIFSTGMEGLFEDSDLVVTAGESAGGNGGSRAAKTPEVRELSALQPSGMSARERNRAKRKARQMARRSSNDTDIAERSDTEPPTKKPKTTSVVVEQAGQADKLLIDQVTDTESSFDESEEWPFAWFCEEMFRNLFNPAWEVRHGASTALREIIKIHGETAGTSIHTHPDKLYSENQRWLVDTAIRIMCVFALDRFADFVSDQVVAPVRATCAQVLGVVVRVMCVEHVDHVVAVLLTLAGQKQWEVRHASLMGIQHLLAARTDLSESLLPCLAPSILQGLQDADDDVRAVAASALLPVASKLHQVLPGKVPELLQILWDSLFDLDDLSASTNSIMELLCVLLSRNAPVHCSSNTNTSVTQTLEEVQPPRKHAAEFKQPQPLGTQALVTLMPRLWPFLSHTISSVRSSCLKVILTLLNSGKESRPLMEEPTEVDDRESGGRGGSVTRCPGWLSGNLQSVLCHIFQRFALEGQENNRNLIRQVWEGVLAHSSVADLIQCSASLVTPWLCLLVAPSSTPVEASLLVPPTHTTQVSPTLYLGGCLGVESSAAKEQAAFMARVAGARALGLLASQVGSGGSLGGPHLLSQLPEGLRQLLVGNSATHKMMAAIIVSFWKYCPADLLPKFTAALTEQSVYDELMPFLIALQKDCHVLIVAFEKKGVNVAKGVNPSGYTAEFAAQLTTTTYNGAIQSVKLSNSEKQEFDSLRHGLLTSLGQLQEEHQRMQTRVHCCMAGALVTLSSLPAKLNPIVRPLMNCIKSESDVLMQSLSAKWLGQLLDICKARSPGPNPRIIKNLCSFACCDPQHTPPVKPGSIPDPSTGQIPAPASSSSKSATPTSEEPSRLESWDWNTGIITLTKQKQPTSMRVYHGRGRPSAAVREAMAVAAEREQQKPLQYQYHGAESALMAVAGHFGPRLFTALPQLWTHISHPLQNLPVPREEEEASPPDDLLTQAQSVVGSLQVLEIVAPSVDPSLKSQLLSLLPLLLTALCSHFTAVRHMAARCITTLAQVDLHHTMEFLVSNVLPYLADDSIIHRQGAIEAIVCILESVGLDALCYVVLLLMPALGRMSDQQEDVRHMASRCFATLVTLMPLELGVESPPEMPSSLAEQRGRQRQFLEQLLDTSKLENYAVPIPIKADLRKYQQDGINWLAFLNKYKLHGILCDDMGLGKTLQSLCIVAGDHYHRVKGLGVRGSTPLPSLVVCPPTLTGHWCYEVRKFCNPEDLRPLQYAGPPNTRARLQAHVLKFNLVVASYDIVRNDIEFFRSVNWNYCILDEGHIIKNTKTKITKAVKQLKANYRLILSGTPIQNNVLELWSLFDFLMPGFLGTERQFYERFGKPILLSRDAKSSSKEQEAGALAMEALHRQVLPFLLRRMKEDVLQDLPPKIIQDYHCDLSPLQVQLYEDFAKSQAKRKVEDSLVEEGGEKEEAQPTTHVFQALQYLRKVCNHPALVVTPDHPLYSKVQEYLRKNTTDLKDIRHAAKLQALKQLLHDCGIGVGGEGGEGVTSAVSQHRALIFCQYKSMLNIIENDLFKIHMPSVTYLRLDGSIIPSGRFEIVHKFNGDPSVDVLLLTTHVGGLGLNLTGADTVIFFEHDWNPMKDLQAMDRAHRIGQKRVVNVYRLITKGTLEEKIMSLQKFKLNIANTVISQENSSLLSMNTSELLDLFQLSDASEGSRLELGGGASQASRGGRENTKSILENMPELWDEGLYKSEYDLSNFMQSLATSNKN